MRNPLKRAISFSRTGFRNGVFGSLRTRLRWSYAMVSVVPLMLLGVILIVFILRGQRLAIAQEQQTAANWVAREIRVSLSAVDEQLLKLGRQLGPGESPQAMQQAIAALYGSMPEIIDVSVVDTNGRERIHVSQIRGFFDSELIDRSEDELIAWTLRSGRVAQGPILYQPDGIRIYPSYAPILSDTGQVLGALRVEVRIDRIARTLREVPLAKGSMAYLVNHQGVLQYADDRSELRVAPPTLSQLLAGVETSREYQSSNGGVVIGAWSPVPIQPSRWWVVVEMPRTLAYAPVQQASLVLIGTIALVIVTTIGWGLYQARHILQPIEEVRAGAVMIGAGDLAARIPIHSDDEIGLLATEFNRMAERLQASRDEVERQNEHLREGLALARDIQLGLLPSAPPGNMPHLTVRAQSLPAYEVGGDFYTYIALDEQRMAVAIGDISGKGVGAALMMALASSMVEAQGRAATHPEQLLMELNQQLSARLAVNRMNAALLYSVIDVDNGTLSVANAGMISPMLLRDGQVQMIEAYGLPLGSMPEAFYNGITIDLQAGDLLLLVSDGIVEAHDANGELFGFDRLEQTLSRHTVECSPDDLIATLMHEVTTFMDETEQHDDMTIVVIQPHLAVPSNVDPELQPEEVLA
jgi:serine phosphatase RsbU (regulator of sigma subunit)